MIENTQADSIFVDLVLTAVTEPWTLRHLVSVDDVRLQARLAHARLLAAFRRIASPAPKQTDIMWPVSEDHIKKALRKLCKKHASILHKN